MHKTLLNLETVTPMFLHGYDTGELELRPPPFKALFRYWWRTVQNLTNSRDLREREARRFGSTDGRSPFSIRIPGEQIEKLSRNSGEYSLLPHKTNMDPVPAYGVEQGFCLELITKDVAATTTYTQIAKLGFLLGGIGNRSRRGFGSIRDTGWSFTNVPGLQNEILNTLNAVAGPAAHTPRFRINGSFSINGHTVQIIESTLPSFPKYPVIWRIYFGNPINDVDQLLENIGWATHNHADSALGGISPQRMASPIHVRIQKINNGFIPIVTQLNSIFPSAAPHSYKKKQQNFIQEIIT